MIRRKKMSEGVRETELREKKKMMEWVVKKKMNE